MIFNSTLVLATSVKALARSVLFTLGIDHSLIDFLANTVTEAATVLLALLYVGARIPRHGKADGR